MEDKTEKIIGKLRLKREDYEVFNEVFFERGWKAVNKMLDEQEKRIFIAIESDVKEVNHAYYNGQLRMISLIKSMPEKMIEHIDKKLKSEIEKLDKKKKQIEKFEEK